MTIVQGTPILHAVGSVRATTEPGVFVVEVDVTDVEGERYECEYVSRPEDEVGLAPTIRRWLAENDGSYIVVPYAPPTPEKIRASMPELSARQFRLGLLGAGIAPSQVSAAIDALPPGDDKERAKIEWEHATTFSRTHPLIATIATTLGLTADQIDMMWRGASAL
jgi:hypothetical protein